MMPSNYTENYHLSQWEPEDAVLRKDFNADNAKIDEALKALDTSLSSANRALDEKQSRLQGIRFTKVSGQTAGYTFTPLTGAGWSSWDTVCVLVSYSEVPEDVTLSLEIAKTDNTKQTFTPLAGPGYLLVLFPRRSVYTDIWGFIIADRLIPISLDYSYEEFRHLSARASKTIDMPAISTFGWQ